MWAEDNAALVAMVPSSVAERDLREPPNAPKGVRFAATMKMLDMVFPLIRGEKYDRVSARWWIYACSGS